MEDSSLLHAGRSADVLEALLDLTDMGLWELELATGRNRYRCG